MCNWKRILPGLSALMLLGIALWVLEKELEDFRIQDAAKAIHSLPPSAILLAIALTTASYSTLALLEIIGFRIVGSRLPFPRIALSSFVGYSLANTIGMPLFTGIPIRVRLYSAAGVLGSDIARVIAFTSAGFWLGVIGLAGLVLSLEPQAVPLPADVSTIPIRALGIVLAVAAAGYVVLCATRREPIRIWRWHLALPKPGLVAAQMILAWIDWGLAAGVLYALLPSHHGLTYKGFLAVFLTAQILGLLSQIPAGLGVMESLVVIRLSPALPVATILGALLVYRVIYFLVPFAIAVSALGYSELRPASGPQG